MSVTLGSPCEDGSSVGRRCAVYRQCISTLQQNDLNNKMASELVALLMLEVTALVLAYFKKNVKSFNIIFLFTERLIRNTVIYLLILNI